MGCKQRVRVINSGVAKLGYQKCAELVSFSPSFHCGYLRLTPKSTRVVQRE